MTSTTSRCPNVRALAACGVVPVAASNNRANNNANRWRARA
jgi:hypothetical protein